VSLKLSRLALLSGLLLLLLASSAGAGVIVLTDGRAIRIQGDYTVQSGRVLFWLDDGTYASLRESEVDLRRTQRANDFLGSTGSKRRTVGPVEADEKAVAPERSPRPPGDLTAPEASAKQRLESDRAEPTGPVDDQPPDVAERDAATQPAAPFEQLEEDEQFQALLHTPTRSPEAVETEPEDGLQPDPGKARLLALLRTPRRGPGEWSEPSGGSPHPPARGRRSPVGPGEGLAAAAEATARAGLALGRSAPGSRSDPGRARFEEPRLLSPHPGEAVWGPTPIVVDVPEDQVKNLAGVDISVDGVLLASMDAPPWETLWQAPDGRGTRTVEAVLHRRDGSSQRLDARVMAVKPDLDVAVDLVPLHVTVTNRDRVPVTDLTRDDFILYEDGVLQTITHFSRKQVPLAVALVVDLSFSMNGRKLDFATDAARGLLSRLEPGDRVALYAFDDEIRAVLPFTSDRARVRNELAQLELGGGTALFDTLLKALDGLERERAKRVVIVVSDGEDYHSKAKLEDVLGRAARLDTLIYAIGVSGRRMQGKMPEHWAAQLMGPAMPAHWAQKLRLRGIKYLRRLAEVSGGVLYMPRYEDELPYVYRHIHEDLKNQYELGYYSSNKDARGAFRRVSLYLTTDGYDARTREGYYADSGQDTRRASR
jgi:Ca-activated chloride channel family protein